MTNLLGEIVTYNKVMCYTSDCQPRFYTFFCKICIFSCWFMKVESKVYEKLDE